MAHIINPLLKIAGYREGYFGSGCHSRYKDGYTKKKMKKYPSPERNGKNKNRVKKNFAN